MQKQQIADLLESLDGPGVKALSEKKAEAKDEKELQEGKEGTQDAPEAKVVSLDEAQDAKIEAARKVPVNARVGAIAEACGGTRDPSLTEA